MKRIVEKVKTHRKIVHAHLKKHHKKYLFGFLSAALLIKIIPALIAWIATWHFNFSFADDNPQSTNNTEITGTNWEENWWEENWWEENWWEENWWEENWWEENWWEENWWEENWWEGNWWEENWWEENWWEGNWWEENWWEGNWWEENWWEGNWWEGNWWEENWWNTEISYTITYTDGVEEEEVFADQVTTWLSLWDNIPEFNWTPTRTWYTFSGWTPEVTGNVAWDRIYTAQWNENNNTTSNIWWDVDSWQESGSIVVSSTIDGISVLTICNPKDETACVTMMDRNLWATTNDIYSTWSYWYLYQWWNNYGFTSCYKNWCSTFPDTENMSNTRVDMDTTSWYSWSVFIVPTSSPYDWVEPSNNNLWWWSWDDTNWWVYSMVDSANRQGPCPEWFHVPSQREMKNVLEYWAEGNGVEWYEPFQGNYSPWDVNMNFLKFQSDFKIPFAGGYIYRSNNVSEISEIWISAFLWLSTPMTNGAANFHLSSNSSSAYWWSWRTAAYPVRCFKNPDCLPWNVIITYPISWEYLKLQDTKVQWHLSGSACGGEVFTIKLYWWTNKWNITLWTVSANSWEFSNLSGFNNTWLLETKFAIYLWDSEDDLEPLKDSPTFYLDDEKPEISSASYKFTPERTSIFGLNDKVDIIFTWSEELTWITVNVLWRNATFVSKSDLKYTYSIQLSTGNNTWQFLYNISFRDLAGNTWYYEYYNSWLVTDTTLPEISGLEFRRISDKTWFVSFSLTKTWKVTFYYVLSWWKATETLTESNIKSFSTNLGRARTDKSWYIYKYTITLEDLAGNKNYYAGTFQLSWDTISYNVVTASWSTIKTWTAVSMISILSDELSVFSWCKAKTGMNYTLIQYNVRVNGKTNIVKVQMPKFNDASIQSSAETVSKLLVDWLQWSTISWLNQSKLNVFAWELNDYFVLVKMKRDPEICNANLSILPSLYMTRLLNTLKKYKIIK